ncbi:MAG: hypothetical protein ACREQF_02240 [Candidatus Binataceae bacterium]
MNWLSDMVENRMLFRRLVLVSTFALNGWAIWSAFEFAKVSRFDGMGTAAVIGAILVPLSGLTGYVFSWYSQARIARKEVA